MRNPKDPPTLPPPVPREPFLLLRTPPSGTQLGLASPPALAPRASAPAAAQAPVAGPAEPRRVDLADLANTPEGLRVAEGLRLELAHFRQWLPGQLVQLERGTRARRRARRGQWLTGLAGVALALLLAVVSGATALRWPAYGRLVARAAPLPAPPASDPRQ
jgi:hypothetical protein